MSNKVLNSTYDSIEPTIEEIAEIQIAKMRKILKNFEKLNIQYDQRLKVIRLEKLKK